MKVLIPSVACLLLIGCGGTEPVEMIMEPEFLTVRNDNGEQRVIPAGELIDAQTGNPTAKSVLAIDRRTGKQTWVSVEVIRSEPPTTGRYFPVTQTDPGTLSKPDETTDRPRR